MADSFLATDSHGLNTDFKEMILNFKYLLQFIFKVKILGSACNGKYPCKSVKISGFKNSNSGFSLVEVILVMVFFGVALIASFQMMSSSISGSMNVEILTTATNLANEKMETIFADKKSRGYAYVIQNNYQSETNPNNQMGFSRSVAIVSQSTNKEVTVTVSHANISTCVLKVFITNY